MQQQRPKADDIIRVVRMAEDPNPLPPGALGRVRNVQSLLGRGDFVIDVEWLGKHKDRSLSVIVPPDEFVVEVFGLEGKPSVMTSDGDALRDEALGRVAENANKDGWFAFMLGLAFAHCQKHGFVTSDDLRAYADEHGWQPHHQNAWGAIFLRKCFKQDGYVKSRRPGNHSRQIKRWTIDEGALAEVVKENR